MATLSDPLVRIISSYLCPFKSNVLLNDILKYGDERDPGPFTVGMLLYCINNDSNVTVSVDFIERHVKSMYTMLIDNFDELHSNISEWLFTKLQSTPWIVDMNYPVEHMNFNLTDYIVWYACTKNNRLFLDYYIQDNIELREQKRTRNSIILCRCHESGRRIDEPGKYSFTFKASIGNIIEIFVKTADKKSLEFLINYFGINNELLSKIWLFDVVAKYQLIIRNPELYQYLMEL